MNLLFHESQDLYKRFSNFIYQYNRDIIDLENKLKNKIEFLKKYQYRDELKPEKEGMNQASRYFSRRSKTPRYSSLEDIKNNFQTLRDDRIEMEQAILTEYLANKEYYDKKLKKFYPVKKEEFSFNR
ncbi:MAG: hypothetical protein ACFFDH_05180 [Promethearchaeota archaeon]